MFCRLQGDGVHLRDNQRGRDARDSPGLQRGHHRNMQLRVALQGPAPGDGHQRRGGRAGLRMGRLLRQHRLRLRHQPRVRGHRRKGQVAEGEDESAQQRGGEMGKFHIRVTSNCLGCNIAPRGVTYGVPAGHILLHVFPVREITENEPGLLFFFVRRSPSRPDRSDRPDRRTCFASEIVGSREQNGLPYRIPCEPFAFWWRIRNWIRGSRKRSVLRSATRSNVSSLLFIFIRVRNDKNAVES